jgi:hypothetical protein
MEPGYLPAVRLGSISTFFARYRMERRVLRRRKWSWLSNTVHDVFEMSHGIGSS